MISNVVTIQQCSREPTLDHAATATGPVRLWGEVRSAISQLRSAMFHISKAASPQPLRNMELKRTEEIALCAQVLQIHAHQGGRAARSRKQLTSDQGRCWLDHVACQSLVIAVCQLVATSHAKRSQLVTSQSGGQITFPTFTKDPCSSTCMRLFSSLNLDIKVFPLYFA